MIKFRNYFYLLFILIFFNSCSAWKTPYRVLKPNKHTVFSSNEELTSIREHIMSVDDRFLVQVMPNNAEQIIFPVEGESVGLVEERIYRDITYAHVSGYRIAPDSTVWLPGIGKTKIAGKTLTEAEIFLKLEFSKIFNDPYVKITIMNKKAYFYSGGKNSISVTINEPNLSLIDLISTSGGIASSGKAKKVYLLRRSDNSYKIYKFDLSSADDLKYSRIIIQSNDIIFVEPRVVIASRFLEDIAPYMSILTTTLIAISLFR